MNKTQTEYGKLPKYKILYKWITDQIYNGTFKYMEKLPSESELCNQFQISRQTVRNAFQELETDGLISRSKGSGSFVAKEVEVFQKEKIIGILFTNVGNYISSKILTGFETVFYPKGYSLLLEQSHNRLENESLFLKKMLNSKVSGLIIESVKSSLPSPYTDLYEQLRLHHIPFVFINNRLCNVDAPSVMWDDEKASYLMTKRLIQKGHTKIAGLFRFDETQGLNRYLGYIKALKDFNIPIQEDFISWYGLSGQKEESKRQFKNIDLFIDDISIQCSALICYNDHIACHVVPYLASKNISVPEDLTVISFDNSNVTKLYDSTRVPSINHPKEKLGEMAANLLLQYIEAPTSIPSGHPQIIFPVSKEQELTILNGTINLDFYNIFRFKISKLYFKS